MQNDPAASVARTDFYILVPGNGEALMIPPPPPPGYELISAVQAVSSAELSGYWACLAYQQQGVYGLLIYWQRDTIYTFYPTEDALHLLRLYGSTWGFDLLGNYIQGEPGQDELDSNGRWWRQQNMCVDQHTQAKEGGIQQ